MSDPFKLYDKDGNVVIHHSPAVAEVQIAEGELFVNPPVKKSGKKQAASEATDKE